MAFIDLMKEKARKDVKTIVLPESNDERTLTAAAQVMKEKTANLILLGNEEKIMADAKALGADLTGVAIVDPETDPKFEHYAETLFHLREKKGMTLEKARETLKADYITYGVMMVKENDADGLVAGACHATADTLRPALQILKTAPGTELVSGFFIMDVPQLRIWSQRNLPVCRLRLKPGSHLRRAGGDRRQQRQELQGSGRRGTGGCDAVPFHHGKRKACPC